MFSKESAWFGKVPILGKHPWTRTNANGKDYLLLKPGASNGSGIHKPSTSRSLAHPVRDPLYMEHFFPMCQTDFLIA